MFLGPRKPIQICHTPLPRRLEGNRKVILFMVCFLVVTLFTTGIGQAIVIDDRTGSAIYWGGKYVNIKPSGYRDVIGNRSAVDQMEVIVTGDIMTVKDYRALFLQLRAQYQARAGCSARRPLYQLKRLEGCRQTSVHQGHLRGLRRMGLCGFLREEKSLRIEIF